MGKARTKGFVHNVYSEIHTTKTHLNTNTTAIPGRNWVQHLEQNPGPFGNDSVCCVPFSLQPILIYAARMNSCFRSRAPTVFVHPSLLGSKETGCGLWKFLIVNMPSFSKFHEADNFPREGHSKTKCCQASWHMMAEARHCLKKQNKMLNVQQSDILGRISKFCVALNYFLKTLFFRKTNFICPSKYIF